MKQNVSRTLLQFTCHFVIAMPNNSVVFKILAVALSVLLPCEASRVNDKVKEAQLIPNIADEGCYEYAKVVFPTGAEMDLGNILPFTSTLPAPTVTYDFKGKCQYVTVVFAGIPTKSLDLDALLGGAYCHWEVHNIPARDLKKGFHGQSGDELASYLSPLHPTNDHHYTFFVYCQRGHINTRHERHMEDALSRRAYQVKSRARKFHLGNPVACNFANSGLVAGGPDLTD